MILMILLFSSDESSQRVMEDSDRVSSGSAIFQRLPSIAQDPYSVKGDEGGSAASRVKGCGLDDPF